MSNDVIVVRSYLILGTSNVVFEAWEPTTGSAQHSVVKTIGGQPLGKRSSRRVPQHILDMTPGTPERLFEACSWSEQQIEEAIEAIYTRVPELRELGHPMMSDVQVPFDLAMQAGLIDEYGRWVGQKAGVTGARL